MTYAKVNKQMDHLTSTGIQSWTLSTCLKIFKQLVRSLTKPSSCSYTDVAFTHDQANSKFKGLAVEGHHPAIRAHPVLSDEIRFKENQTIFKQMPSINKYQLDVAKAHFDGTAQTTILLPLAKLVMQKPPFWRTK